MSFSYDRLRRILIRSSDSRELIKGAALALLMKLLGAALLFAFQALIAREFGAEGSGAYFLALSVMSIAAVISRMGIDTASVRFVAANEAINAPGSIPLIYRRALMIQLPSAVLATVLIYSGAPWLATTVFDNARFAEPIAVMALGIVPFVMMMLHSELLRALRCIGQAMAAQWTLLPLIAAIVLLPLGGFLEATAAVTAHVIGLSAAALFGVYCFWPQLRVRRGQPGAEHAPGTRQLWETGMPLMWVASMFVINGWVSTLVMGRFSSTEDIGIYNVAQKTAMLVSLVLLAVNAVSSPKFAAFHKLGDHARLESYARQATRLVCLFSIPVLLFFLIAPSMALTLFGPEFIAGESVLRILALGQIVNSMTGSVGQVLIMTGYEHDQKNIVTLGAVSNIVLSFVLIPFFGAVGAAVANAASGILVSIIATIMVKKRLAISINVL